ncbi:MAG TPA: 3-deoxy-manno-octulosonate cytidylyltransferase [Pyrinomonadaceae bacterium]|nr:3-deoxy-manno-octulosonate cytidylyltransferase [Pyrinomonadaceae bacterium]
MEHHGEIPKKQNVVAIIPARYASTRLPGKLLLTIAAEPMILHTIRQAAACKSVDRVLVATDDDRIFRVAIENGFEAVMSSALHRSGSDRVAEVAESLPAETIIVNVQGDEPTISPDTIDRAVRAMLSDKTADIVTTSEPIEESADVTDPNIVKVVADNSGFALYFSRSPIPFPRLAKTRFGDWDRTLAAEPDLLSTYKKHTGLYVYRREFLLRFSRMEQTTLEKLEMLEQLRALENGARIRVVESCSSSIGVDTMEDLERVRRLMEKSNETV